MRFNTEKVRIIFRRFFSSRVRKPRIIPVLLIAGASAGIGSYYFSESPKRNQYTYLPSVRPPTELERSLNIHLSEAQVTIGTLFLLNAAVFLGWKVAPSNLMMTHFSHCASSGYFHTLLTSTFSHVHGYHFLFNMVALWGFGLPLHQRLGRKRFLALYFTSGLLASSGAHVINCARKQFAYHLGASGALYGLLGSFTLFYPEHQLLIFFVLPATVKYATPALAAFDIIGLSGIWRRYMSLNLSHEAHLSGLATGLSLVYFRLPLQKFYESRKTEFRKLKKELLE